MIYFIYSVYLSFLNPILIFWLNPLAAYPIPMNNYLPQSQIPKTTQPFIVTPIYCY